MSLSDLRTMPNFSGAPQRVVSLVPSITESLFTLGFGESVKGISDYCIYPEAALGGIERVGGPKGPLIENILAIKPDIVFCNQEENTQASIQALVDAGIKVWMFFPKTVQEGVDDLRAIVAFYKTDVPAMQINFLQMAVDYALEAGKAQEPVRYFCPIWYDRYEGEHDWWMSFNHDTYTDDLLGHFGGVNIFTECIRKYPLEADLGLGEETPVGERDQRYPRVTAEEIIAGKPEIIILPDEPYTFTPETKKRMLELLADTPAVKNGRVLDVDGSLLFWPGVRIGKAFQELASLFF